MKNKAFYAGFGIMPLMKTTAQYNNKTKEELINLLAEQAKQIDSQAKQISLLEEYILAHKHRQFGSKTETISSTQLSIFNEAKLPKDKEKILTQESEIQVASYTRNANVGRKALPADLPRVPKIYDLDEADKVCDCGSALSHIKDEKTEQLEIIPAKIYVIEHIRKKYACKSCADTIKTAPLPALPIPRSIASSGLLSHVLISKYQDHLPLYRQEKMLKRIGVDLPRTSLSLWVLKCAELLNPLMKLLHDTILNYDIAYADETTCQVIKEPNKGTQSKKYMWLFAGGAPDQFCYYYQYHPARSHHVPLQFFTDFRGYVHCDGFQAYDTLASANKSITLVGCLYHARRKFMEVIKITKATTGVAVDVINHIAKIAKIEDEIKLLSAAEKYQLRFEQAKLLLNTLHDYLMQHIDAIPPKSLLGQAVSYTLNQWPKLLTYLNDGRLDNNNNLSERAIKPFVMGRKNWMFSNSVEGAHAGATIFSLIETCKHHNVEAYDYFSYVLNALPTCTTLDDYEKLLPFNIDKTLLTTNQS